MTALGAEHLRCVPVSRSGNIPFFCWYPSLRTVPQRDRSQPWSPLEQHCCRKSLSVTCPTNIPRVCASSEALGWCWMWKGVRNAQCRSGQEHTECQLCTCSNESGNFHGFIAECYARSTGIVAAHQGCWLLAVSLPSTHLFPSFWLLSLPVRPPAQSSPLCQGDRHDAESSLWLPEAQVWWEVRNSVLLMLLCPCVTNISVNYFIFLMPEGLLHDQSWFSGFVKSGTQLMCY